MLLLSVSRSGASAFRLTFQGQMMVSRNLRIAEFNANEPPAAGCFVELLCEDHVGTYVLPFPCRLADDGWRNAVTGEPIEITVLGWRKKPDRR